ncbi:MAG: asparagine synthase (glutamine-hydrolyzing) [Gemmatimonadaceae bacterium]
MCGIVGAFGVRDADAVVGRMSGALAHRGPDDAGVEVVRDARGAPLGALGHRRLAILDLSAAGHQPMGSAAGHLRIVFNGEIYNYRALRAELEREGARFRSGSDTEVILEGWARHGTAFLPRMRGMYAFALWDARAQAGHLVRDPFGIKPLYASLTGGAVLFASELRALVASGQVNPALDPSAVHGYLRWGSVPEPLTMLRDVRPVPAGTVVRFAAAGGRVSVAEPEPFASPVTAASQHPVEDPAEAAALVREALRDSVRHHLVSDVPVALFLSGGVDSSAVVALAAEQVAEPLETFTVTFGEAEFSEAGPAAAVARRFGTRHHEIPLAGGDFLRELPHAFAAMDQPSLDGLNTFTVSRAVREHGLKVVLSGLGGDELFAGYASFARAARLAPHWGRSRALRRVAGAVAGRVGPRGEKLELLLRGDDPACAAYEASRALFTGALLGALAPGVASGGAAVAGPPAGLSLLQRVSWFELTRYMRDTLLRDSDVFSMAHHLELRVPFVDAGVAAAAMAVADGLKLGAGAGKRVLVDAVRDLLPREVWDRPKQGFQLPYDHWLRDELRGEVAAVLDSPAALRRVGLRPEAVRTAWRGFLDRRAGLTWSRVWALYTLARWAGRLGLAVEDAGSPLAGGMLEAAG